MGVMVAGGGVMVGALRPERCWIIVVEDTDVCANDNGIPVFSNKEKADEIIKAARMGNAEARELLWSELVARFGKIYRQAFLDPPAQLGFCEIVPLS